MKIFVRYKSGNLVDADTRVPVTVGYLKSLPPDSFKVVHYATGLDATDMVLHRGQFKGVAKPKDKFLDSDNFMTQTRYKTNNLEGFWLEGEDV